MVETSLPKRDQIGLFLNTFIEYVATLAIPGVMWSGIWHTLDLPRLKNWHGNFALADAERLRRKCVIEALVAHAYGLSCDEFEWMLRECDHPRASIGSDDFTRTLDPKGFWRVDKEREPELRHTVLSLVAFHDLQRLGLEAFLNQNNGEAWLLPATLRLADYGLGHDDRAREPQPVAARLGERFYPWQLEGTVEESWEECRRHAENLRLIRAIGAPASAAAVLRDAPAESWTTAAPASDLLGAPIPRDLLGKEVPPRRRR